MPSPQPLNPLCHPDLLTHGTRTARAVVLLHGISSCPRAFVDFAPQLFATGANVVSLRMPENGYADRATDALRQLTAVQLRDWGDQAVDIAAGLGDEVVVLGISAGGVVAAWCGQNRPEVARAVLVAPMFGLSNLGAALNAAIMRLTLFLPDFPIWKDPVLRARYKGMPHAYLRQSSRATGEILRLAASVRRQADAGPPAARQGVLVTNAADTAIDNGLAGSLVDAWARHGMAVRRHEFPRSCGLGHEIIDPMEPGADPALTYPLLLAMIEGRPSQGRQYPGGSREDRRTGLVPSMRALSAELEFVRHICLVTTSKGKAFDPVYFGAWFAEAIEAAGLPEDCVLRGLRTAAARRLAEAGCTEARITAITGHRTKRNGEEVRQRR